jgi:hypothetical protein
MASVLSTGLKVGLASAVGAAGAYAVLVALQNTLGHGFAGSAAGLVVGGVVGLVVFGVVAWQMRIPEIRQLATLGRGR